MNHFVDVTLIANAGVLVECDGVGVLVDGIHHEDGPPFSKVSELDLQHLKKGTDGFENLDYLLFTHEHPDHFTPQLVLEQLRQRPAKEIFLPSEKGGSPDLTRLFESAGEVGVSCHGLSLEPGESSSFALAGNLAITAIGTRHMGPQYQHIRNDCYLLDLDGVRLLFTGDADYVPEYFAEALGDVPLDAVFVNPIFYHNPAGQRVIADIFKPRHVVVYHIPFAQDDTMRFARMVERDMEKHRQAGYETLVLKEERQRLRFSRN
ncbi:MAG: MBL fold metallo-hydrolase [Desulfovibrio sp.]|uniref:MBL fold metallo-hydrolase n=1 Tax=Desulfovibrio sp. 7SRBS1 TaxID=3378064 RepID=UPI003B41320C